MSEYRASITLRQISLAYNLFFDGSTTLKEYIVGAISRKNTIKHHETKHYALDNISFNIDHGERVGIIGLNGSGKSTLLKLVAGLVIPTSGVLDIVGSVQPLIEIGAGFNPEFTGRENIYFNGAMLGFTRNQIRDKETEIIEFCELGEFIDVPVKYYSSGMAVRLAFTIATIIRPEILVLDEMLAAGDLEFIQKAKARLEQVLSSAKILLLVSHDLDFVRNVCRRVIVLDKGQLVFDGRPDEAIEFYSDIVYRNLENKKKIAEVSPPPLATTKNELEEPVDSDSEMPVGNPIIVSSAKLFDQSGSVNRVSPEQAVRFRVEFEIQESFPEFYVNLVIKNKTETEIAHFRNDFSGKELRDIQPGCFSATIQIESIPFRSNPYSSYFRLVGVNQSGQMVIVDSAKITFEIVGEKQKDNLIAHEWQIVGEQE